MSQVTSDPATHDLPIVDTKEKEKNNRLRRDTYWGEGGRGYQ